MRRYTILPALILVACATSSTACLWDYDTLQQERESFPSTLELLVGKFPRHSDAFYRWRIADRRERLKSEPDNLALYDDIAVAWDKLGDSERAITVMREKEAIRSGDYETLANLGTFYIHAGRLEEGTAYIRQAIEVNPDAHFGREIYQLRLVEYVLSRRSADGKLPQPLRAETTEADTGDYVGFAAYVTRDDVRAEGVEQSEERDAALEGVLGMMRFGHPDSPILLEVLGDLLQSAHADELGARAYLLASYHAENEISAAVYRRYASEVNRAPFYEIADRLKTEMADANEWVAQLHADERRWIAAAGSVNPDEMFAMAYAEAPLVNSPEPWLAWYERKLQSDKEAIVFGTAAALLIPLWGLKMLAVSRRRRALTAGLPLDVDN